MKSRPGIEKAAVYLLLALIGYIIADLGVLMSRDKFLPVPPPPSHRNVAQPQRSPDRGSYNMITSRNIFNSDGKIPPPMGMSPDTKGAPDAAPVPSQLPLQLMGTIVHVTPERSVATITLKSKNEQIPVKVNGVIPDNLATVTKIERTKLTFRNNANQHLEFIEMKDDSKINFGVSALKPIQDGPVLKKSENDFELKQNDIDKLTSNLPELLQQARAVPRMGPNGQIECFNMADIAAGSIYEKLGLKRGDCIKSVNGEKIDSPAKAMELYNALRANANAINLGVERGGQDQNFNYNITK
jgi:general secretion pathway protein C